MPPGDANIQGGKNRVSFRAPRARGGGAVGARAPGGGGGGGPGGGVPVPPGGAGGGGGLGVVFPDLRSGRTEVLRVFSNVMRPGWNLPAAGRRAMPFDISIGAPLSEHAIVDFALRLLDLSCREIDFK